MTKTKRTIKPPPKPRPKVSWRCGFCGLLHKGEPCGKHQPVK